MEPKLRRTVSSKQFTTTLKNFLHNHCKELKRLIKERKIIPQKTPLLEKQYHQLLGTHHNSLRRINPNAECLGIFQSFINNQHQESIEPTSKQLEFLSKLAMNFESIYNSATKEEIQQGEYAIEEGGIKRAYTNCLDVINIFSKSESDSIAISPEILIHARLHISPIKTRFCPTRERAESNESPNKRDSQKNSNNSRDRSNTISL